MKIKSICITFIMFASLQSVFSQYSKTANEKVPVYDGSFTFGTNPGWPTNAKWSSEQLANIYAGNEELGIKGIGANTVRATLPDHFLEKWGYDNKLKAYAHYKTLGMKDLTCFIGFPSDEHTDGTIYGTKQSQMFKNMYEDIWDGGANGTPVNDNNYYALYVYKTAMKYGDIIKYWEIWNEPDFTSSSAASKAEGTEDSWWTRVPKPDELSNLTAPFYHYIRLLRISYEVIKYVEEDDYVCLGGIGYESFLDACLRYSDNPTDGSVTTDYPYTGGAYFDCVSFHSYPMYFLRKWSNEIAGFEYSRYSDKALEALLNKKNGFETLLGKYKYDGIKYPKKAYILTETNLPAAEFDWYYGSDEFQYNFLMKTIISSQINGIQSLHTYALYDTKERSKATNSYHVMGMYRCLSVVEPYQQVANPSAHACRSTMTMLGDCRYDEAKTSEMQLPSTIGGGAFKSADGSYVYALWAKTTIDKSEVASVDYSFPASFKVDEMHRYNWDYSETLETDFISGTKITLSGTPVFIKTFSNTDSKIIDEENTFLSLFPNPVKGFLNIETAENNIPLKVEICNIHSQTVLSIEPKSCNFNIDMSHFVNGTYVVRFQFKTGIVNRKMIVQTTGVGKVK